MRRYYLAVCTVLLFACNNSDNKEKGSAGKDSPVIGCGSQTSDKNWYSSGKKAPRFKGLEGVDFKISTSNKEAQEYFAQGMMLAYGFNHA